MKLIAQFTEKLVLRFSKKTRGFWLFLEKNIHNTWTQKIYIAKVIRKPFRKSQRFKKKIRILSNKNIFELPTKRLMLRTIKQDMRLDEYLDWLNNPLVNRFLETRFKKYTETSLRSYIANLSEDTYLLGIYTAKEATHIGNIKLEYTSKFHNTASIGLMIGNQKYWGKGFGTESIIGVTNFAFNRLMIRKICAGCYEKNIASKKAFEKAGYKIEGFLESQVKVGESQIEGVWQLGCHNQNQIASSDE